MMSDQVYLCADLHIHTALSPCAADEMTPAAIVSTALKSHLDVIAITDHNSAENVEAVMRIGHQAGLLVIPGMEVQTKEEVHVVTLFPTIDKLLVWQQRVYNAMLPIDNQVDFFGHQWRYTADGHTFSEFNLLLHQSINLTLDEVIYQVLKLDGVAVLAHIHRTANGIIPLLGFIPPDLGVATIEFSRHQFRMRQLENARYAQYNKIVSSDAHVLEDLFGQPATALQVKEPTIKSVLSLLKTKDSTDRVVIF